MYPNKRPASGFSLIELLVVLALIGAMSGIVAPNFWNLFTKTMEQQDLLEFTEKLEALRLKAWSTGHSIQLPPQDDSKWPTLPTGWQLHNRPNLRFLATGLTNGGQLILTSPANNGWQIDIRMLDGRITLTFLGAKND